MVCRGSLFFHALTHWLEGDQRSGVGRMSAVAAVVVEGAGVGVAEDPA